MSTAPADALAGLGDMVAETARAALAETGSRAVAIASVETLLDYDSVAQHVIPGRVVVTSSSVDGLAGRSMLLLSGTAAARIGGRDLPSGAPEADPAADAAPEVASSQDASTEAGDPTPDPSTEQAPEQVVTPSEDELAAVRALGVEINDAVAAALSLLLGQSLHYEPPETAIVEDPRFIVRRMVMRSARVILVVLPRAVCSIVLSCKTVSIFLRISTIVLSEAHPTLLRRYICMRSPNMMFVS